MKHFEIMVGKTLAQILWVGLTGVIIWIAYSVYIVIYALPQVEVSPAMLLPISPQLSESVLQNISARTQLATTIEEIMLEEVTPNATF